MAGESLDDLHKPEFVHKHMLQSSAEGLVRSLRRSKSIRELSRQFSTGELSVSVVQRFVSKLMSEYQAGTHFEFEIQLAAIAVTLESTASEFSREFLSDLSRVKAAEMLLAPAVASVCKETNLLITSPKIKFERCKLPIVVKDQHGQLGSTVKIFVMNFDAVGASNPHSNSQIERCVN